MAIQRLIHELKIRSSALCSGSTSASTPTAQIRNSAPDNPSPERDLVVVENPPYQDLVDRRTVWFVMSMTARKRSSSVHNTTTILFLRAPE